MANQPHITSVVQSTALGGRVEAPEHSPVRTPEQERALDAAVEAALALSGQAEPTDEEIAAVIREWA